MGFFIQRSTCFIRLLSLIASSPYVSKKYGGFQNVSACALSCWHFEKTVCYTFYKQMAFLLCVCAHGLGDEHSVKNSGHMSHNDMAFPQCGCACELPARHFDKSLCHTSHNEKVSLQYELTCVF